MNAARGRRDLTTIYVDILRAIELGARKSHIVYKANLNFCRCRRYLDDLLGMELIKIKTHSPPTWTITERGLEFLKKYGELRGLLLPR